jgi:glycosyltransferase involved in cell wall biosynthesis
MAGRRGEQRNQVDEVIATGVDGAGADRAGPRRPRRVLVVVPAWNEAEVITGVLGELAAAAPQLDVVVVDDGSTDATSAVVAAAGSTVLTLPFNLGVGGAMRAGLLYAARNGYDGVVQVDADGQHDPAQIERLLAALEQVDVAVGSRFAGGEPYLVRGPRRWAMKLLAWAMSRMCHTRLTDVTSGFRATGPRAIALLARYYPREYLGDTVESLVVVQKAGLRVREVGVSMRPRAGGTPSQSSLRSAAYLARALLVLLLAVIRTHPGAAATPAVPTLAARQGAG